MCYKIEVLWNSLQHLKALFSFNFLVNCHPYTLQKMFNLDDITNENNKDHNSEWSYVPDHPYRTLKFGGFGSGKTNALLDLIKE